MKNIFLNEYYELAMVIVGLNPDTNDFENEEKVVELLYNKFGINDYSGFVDLIEMIKFAIEASVPPFDIYVQPKNNKKVKK